MYPSQVTSFVGTVGLMSVMAAGVVAVMNGMLGSGVFFLPETSKRYSEIEGRYGKWATELAIASCPTNDWECIEKEAKKLYEARIYRR